MMDLSDDVLLRRRRRFFMVMSLIAGCYSAEGILIGVASGDGFSYFIAASFGVCAILWARRLLTPPEVLLRMRADHFDWLAPEFEDAPTLPSEMRPAGKPSPPLPEPTLSCGVWDRELDGSP
jgi:hypothetical protein